MKLAASVFVAAMVSGCVHASPISSRTAPAEVTELVLKEFLTADTRLHPGIVALKVSGARRPSSARLTRLLPLWSFKGYDHRLCSTAWQVSVGVDPSVEGLRQVEVTNEPSPEADCISTSPWRCRYTLTGDGQEWTIVGRHCDNRSTE